MTAATHKGSCHCGKVRFTAGLDLARSSVRCNCSICAKGRMWLAMAEPGTFSVAGEDALTTYTFGPERVRHRFCATCGMKPFAEVKGMGTAINLACVDDLTPADRAAIAVMHIDGAEDRFDRAPDITSYL